MQLPSLACRACRDPYMGPDPPMWWGWELKGKLGLGCAHVITGLSRLNPGPGCKLPRSEGAGSEGSPGSWLQLESPGEAKRSISHPQCMLHEKTRSSHAEPLAPGRDRQPQVRQAMDFPVDPEIDFSPQARWGNCL